MGVNFMLILAAASLSSVALLSLPAFMAIVERLTKRASTHEFCQYGDEDGQATPGSLGKFTAKWPKVFVLIFAVATCGLSFAVAVLSPVVEELFPDNWLIAGSSIALLVQAAGTASSRKSVQSYNLGTYLSLSSALMTGILLVQEANVAESLPGCPPSFVLRLLELASTGSLAIVSLYIPRRPDVYFDGELIDRMYSVSAFERFNFSWASDILSLATKKKNLGLADFPRPDHKTRSADLSAVWKQKNFTHPLWLSLILAHWKTFSLQWALTLLAAVLDFAPQLVILQLLTMLESIEGRDYFGPEVWTNVFWLAVALIAESWVESYVFWLSWAELSVPIRSQLSSLIFEKAMRKKDVKCIGTSRQDDSGQKDPRVNDSEEPKHSKQITVNLIGVDAKRVSDFCANQNLFPSSLFKLIISLIILTKLLGWRPLLAGFSAIVIITPINIFFSKRYSDAQEKLMQIRDEKTAVVAEAIYGIRQIKFSALEPDWEGKINDAREKELASIWSVFIADTMILACWITSPILLSAISLATHAIITGSLVPSIAFVSLGVFKALEVTLSFIPELATDLLDAWVSMKRIEDYLSSPEISILAKTSETIVFTNATITWPSDEDNEGGRFILRSIDLVFPKGELSVISGKTGTGKSLLLSAILGEVNLLDGDIYMPEAPGRFYRQDGKANKGNWILPGAIAYVAQIPWIENASVRDNVLFGLPLDAERYSNTIDACALKRDLETMTDGDNTEIGANGINLSGGQKWRIALARAIYSRAGILVLDDIFSAVDAHVGRHIFEKCLHGELANGRTRILVTHHTELCRPKARYFVELGDGRVLSTTTLSEGREEVCVGQVDNHIPSADEVEVGDCTGVNSADSPVGREENLENLDERDTPERVSITPTKQARRFVEEEAGEHGAIGWRVYLTYLSDSGSVAYWIGALLVFVLIQVFAVGQSWWLRIWTSDYKAEGLRALGLGGSYRHVLSYLISPPPTSVHMTADPTTQGHDSFWFYLGIYIALAVVSSIIGTLRFFYIYVGSIQASRKLFARLNFVIFRAPLRWLDTVPVGRILNRFTADFAIIDSQLANSASFSINAFLTLIGIIVSGFLVNPLIVLLAAVLLCICLFYAIRYMNVARPIKRLESIAKSPVFEQFGSALTGVTTIRAFDKTQTYVQRMHRNIDDFGTATWYLWLFNRWMGWRMAMIGSFFASFVAILLLLTPGIDSALAGFALAFAIEFSDCIMWTIRFYANFELNMNAAERIIEYAEVPTEPLDGSRPPAAWPTNGCIEVEDLVVGYAADLPPVLNGVTFSVYPSERIGVVGRTGAGKSSLTLALFRFLEARSGSIHVDGLDISKMKLDCLRSRLAIIPQDPVLFSGTVRSNLDPFDDHCDAALRDCLQRVHLVNNLSDDCSVQVTDIPSSMPGNANIFENLDSPISEGGLNVSQGQRQLLCLARAIVSRPRIMVLDEATSAVDMHTDALIQRSIREEFAGATLLVIAHRLSTIADFDRILVLSDGQVAEYGTPRELWDKGETGVFRSMCEESGEKNELQDLVFGEGSRIEFPCT